MSLPWADWSLAALELDVVARLKAATQTGDNAWARVVGTRADIEDVREDQQLVPGVYAIYSGFSVKSADERSAELEHRLRVVLALRKAGSGKDTSSVNAEAGKRLAQLMLTLHGYTPVGCTTALVPATPPAIYHNGPFSYYPLAFTATTLYSTRRGPSIGDLPFDRR